MNDKEERFRDEMWKVLNNLTSIMDRMREELKRDDDPAIQRASKSFWCLEVSQQNLLKACSWLDPSNLVPPDAKESWEHFLAKNKMVNGLKPQNIFTECSYGEMRFDVIVQIDGEYAIIEAETTPTKCIGKMERIKKTIDDLVSGRIEVFEENNVAVFFEIKKQLQKGKPLRIIFAVTKRPVESTLKKIMTTENFRVHPEVYYVNPKPHEGFPTFKVTRYV